MNYKESNKILAEIKKAKKIIIGCHKSPDADTVGCALSLFQVLENWKKEVIVVCRDKLAESFSFIPYAEVIKEIDFNTFKFDSYGLFIAVDTPDEAHVTGSKKTPLPPIPIIVIDHHKTNPRYGKINLIDEETSSAAEVLFLVFEDWEVKITKDISTTLLTGIISDTGVFRYPSVTAQTFNIARKLMDKGADKNEIIFNISSSIELKRLKLWGEILNRLEIDSKHKFAWSAVPYKVYKKYSQAESGRESFSSLLGHVVKGTNFSIVMTEEREKFHSISLRSRTDFDVSEIAAELGGGGHKPAAGARVENTEFDDAVKKVLQVARKFAKKRR